MVFVADDLGAWLTGLLADTSRKKLTALILGTEQERALRCAATAAVRLTAEELRPGDDEQAEHVACSSSCATKRAARIGSAGRMWLPAKWMAATLRGNRCGNAEP